MHPGQAPAGAVLRPVQPPFAPLPLYHERWWCAKAGIPGEKWSKPCEVGFIEKRLIDVISDDDW